MNNRTDAVRPLGAHPDAGEAVLAEVPVSALAGGGADAGVDGGAENAGSPDSSGDAELRDAIVVGGGAAGLNAALILARSRRRVTVIDAGEPRNAPADGVHGLLGREGMPPSELLALGRAEVASYGGELRSDIVVAARRLGDATDAGEASGASGATADDASRDLARFEVTLAGGSRLRARRLIIATGLVDELPEIPGLRERWGRDVLHCPYCHGWEVRDQNIAVLATGPMLTHQALLFRQLSDRVTLFVFDTEVGDADAATLAALGIRVVPGASESIEVHDDHVTGVRLAGGEVIPAEAVAVATRMAARAEPLEGLGIVAAEHPSGMGSFIEADALGRVGDGDIWVAGNATDISAQVGAAAAAGAMAGAQANADMVMEDARRAVALAAVVA
ncbi:MAG: NAD(P)/FAD-dependent oxidoreductase [Pseudoclavibacter sp.]